MVGGGCEGDGVVIVCVRGMEWGRSSIITSLGHFRPSSPHFERPYLDATKRPYSLHRDVDLTSPPHICKHPPFSSSSPPTVHAQSGSSPLRSLMTTYPSSPPSAWNGNAYTETTGTSCPTPEGEDETAFYIYSPHRVAICATAGMSDSSPRRRQTCLWPHGSVVVAQEREIR